jgi:predicted GNAT family N-acyltransferase
MSGQFVTYISPPGAAIQAYPKHDVDAVPPSSVPSDFADAMTVRKAVFITEQGCRLEYEIDEDDERSHHWVVYASVGVKSHSSSGTSSPEPTTEYERRKIHGGQVPIGTIRLVPPPHAKHPIPNSIDGIGGDEVKVPEYGDRPTKLHNGKEAYVKLGRMAVIKEFRGYGLGHLLVNQALEFAKHHKRQLQCIPLDAVEESRLLHDLGASRFGDLEWKGLVMVHAQLDAVRFYAKNGFVVDEELGTWIEEGIEHVAMWKRIELA